MFGFSNTNGTGVTCICLRCNRHNKIVVVLAKPPSYIYVQLTTLKKLLAVGELIKQALVIYPEFTTELAS